MSCVHIDVIQIKGCWFKIRMEYLREILVEIEWICQQPAMTRPTGVMWVLAPAVLAWIGWLGADTVFWAWVGCRLCERWLWKTLAWMTPQCPRPLCEAAKTPREIGSRKKLKYQWVWVCMAGPRCINDPRLKSYIGHGLSSFAFIMYEVCQACFRN